MGIDHIIFYFVLIPLGLAYIWLGIKWRWIYLGVIIPTFVIPGLLKVLGMHMITDVSIECKKMCELSPVDTVFYFFGYSRLLIRTVGLIQFISGIFLISKKYRLLGLMSCLIICSFINLLNISFWGVSNVTLFMAFITISIITYLYLDYKHKLKGVRLKSWG